MECLPLYSSFENVEICEHSQLFPLQCWQGLPPSYNAELYLTVVILVPHLILVYCNIRVFQATRSMRKVSVFLSAPSRYSKGIQQCREHRITVVTFMVTITFFVCWMPYCISTICKWQVRSSKRVYISSTYGGNCKQLLQSHHLWNHEQKLS